MNDSKTASQDLHVDPLAHALGDHTELFELVEDALQLRVVLVAVGQLQLHRRLRNAPEAVRVAHRRGGDVRDHADRVVLELAHREQQAGGQAIGDAGQQDARGIGAALVAQRRGLVAQLRRQVGFVELDAEREVRFLLEGRSLRRAEMAAR